MENSFDIFFKKATDNIPYPFQRRLATSDKLPDLIDIPTGLGKTDAIILGWLWRRRFDPRKEVRLETPRRLVYCLPMRVLVEQTRDKTKKWLENLGLLAYMPGDDIPVTGWAADHDRGDNRIAVTVLMGGEDKDEWDIYPERDAIIIGTQDMLLSRALNRGYGMNRYRWPTHFGLLNNDCMWVMDEVQLMGRGLATTTQIQAFRQRLGTIDDRPVKSIWMSATIDKEWLGTVDFNPETNLAETLTLEQDDRDEDKIWFRIQAEKTLRKAEADANEPNKLAEAILEKHNPESRTLVVLNTVSRAVKLYEALKKKNEKKAKLLLIHSRFRPPDRKNVIDKLIKKPPIKDTIVVSTQVVEAGVDISSQVMFTELAPWPSLVQRFGRCKRFGEPDDAEVYWIDVPTNTKGSALPYTEEELDKARKVLLDLDQKSVGPDMLPKVPQKFDHKQVIRLKDVLELFDTTPDLAGHDVDVSRFIREISDNDVQVFWRDLPDEGPSDDEPEARPHRDELCTVPIGEVHSLIEKGMDAWLWDALDGKWSHISLSQNPLYPGVILVLRSKEGHYTNAEGWNAGSNKQVPIVSQKTKSPCESYSGNEESTGGWMSVVEHTDQVCKEMDKILDYLGLDDSWRRGLIESARWHDAGKAHKSFQAKIKKDHLKTFQNPPASKAPKEAWHRGRLPNRPKEGDYRRKYFRHELASGVLALQSGKDDLTAYLAAAHHGKVRLSIRSMPDEYRPLDEGTRFARGVWDGDEIPKTDLGGGITLPATSIDLSLMELGDGPKGPSWLSRALALRDRQDLGPFRLSFLEALMKAADERASRGEE